MDDQLKYYHSNLDMKNNSKTSRRMKISKNGNVVCNLNIAISKSKPIITLPSQKVLDQLNMFDVDVEIGKYKDYIFGENTLTSFKGVAVQSPGYTELGRGLTGQEVNDYIATRKDVAGNLLGDERYIPYLTVFNPILRTDMVIFLDKLHGDMFYIAGLQFLLDDAVDVSSNLTVDVTGYSISGRIAVGQTSDTTKIMTPSQTFTYDQNMQSDFGKHMNLDKATLLNPDPDVKAFGVAFTKELPHMAGNTSFPIIYDKVNKGGTEVQVCRQDSIPSIIVQLGKLNKFYATGTPNDRKNVFGWLLYCSHLTRVNITPNENIKDRDAIISVIFELF